MSESTSIEGVRFDKQISESWYEVIEITLKYWQWLYLEKRTRRLFHNQDLVLPALEFKLP